MQQRGLFKGKIIFLYRKQNFLPGYPEKTYPGPPTKAAPGPLPFKKGSVFWTHLPAVRDFQ